MEDAGDAAAEDQHGLPRLQAGEALAAEHAGQGLDHRPGGEGNVVGEEEHPPVDVQAGYPYVFGEAAGIVVCGVQGFAGGVAALQAVTAGVAGDMMGDEDPVSLPIIGDAGADSVNDPGDFVPQNQGGLFAPVPFHDVAAADPAGLT